MQQKISPVVGGIIVVVALVVFFFVGYKLFFSGPGTSGQAPPQAQKYLNPGSSMQGHTSTNQPLPAASGRFPGAPPGVR